jgi:hypothetical protein
MLNLPRGWKGGGVILACLINNMTHCCVEAPAYHAESCLPIMAKPFVPPLPPPHQPPNTMICKGSPSYPPPILLDGSLVAEVSSPLFTLLFPLLGEQWMQASNIPMCVYTSSHTTWPLTLLSQSATTAAGQKPLWGDCAVPNLK